MENSTVFIFSYFGTVVDIINNKLVHKSNKHTSFALQVLLYNNYIIFLDTNKLKYIQSVDNQGFIVYSDTPTYFFIKENCGKFNIYDSKKMLLSARIPEKIIKPVYNNAEWELFSFKKIPFSMTTANANSGEFLLDLDEKIDKLNAKQNRLIHEIAEKDHFRIMQKHINGEPNENFMEYLQEWYYKIYKKILDFKNLSNIYTFNEKIQYIKIFNADEQRTRLSDKVKVRDYIREKGYSNILTHSFGVYDNPEEINFDSLPPRYVIKCNHGSGFNIIKNNPGTINKQEIIARLHNFMSINYAFNSFEMQYRYIKPKLLIEEYLENTGEDIYDYKFWCFNGKVKYIQFLSERKNGLKMAFYTPAWKKLNFTYSHPLDPKIMPRPDNLDTMLQIAKDLSKGFNHVRVDLYRLNDGTIYFGEMTFTSLSGICAWSDEKVNLELGQLIDL